MGASYYPAFIATLVVLHFALHVGLGWGAVAPDLIIVAALLAARRMQAPWAAGLGLGLGLMQDALSYTAFGASGIIMCVLCYLGSRSRDFFEGDSILFLAVYLFLGKWLSDVALNIFGRSAPLDPFTLFAATAPLAALYSAVAGSLALAAFRSLRITGRS